MKTILLAAAAMIASPLLAQMTPATGDQAMPAPTASPTPMATGTPMPMASPTPMATDTPMPMASATPDASMTPAPTASTGKLPWCRAGQYTGCRERSNAKGEGMSKN